MDWARQVARIARRLAREPGFTLGALVLLALGIGLSTAAFGVLDRLLWQPLPGVAAVDRLVTIYSREGDTPLSVATYADLIDLGERGRAVDLVASFKAMQMEVETAGAGDALQADLTTGMLVSADYFRVLGLAPAAGRFFVREESATPGGLPVVVLGHDLWQRRFGGRADVSGRTITVDGMRCTVVGVAPPGFGGTSEDLRAALFLPMALQPRFMGEDMLAKRGWGGVLGLARLAPGATLRQATEDLARVSRELAREYPDTNRDRTMILEPLAAAHLSALSRSLWQGASAMLAATVALVLLVACTHVATLLSTRAVARRAELGLLRSLGATPRRLAAELVIEALLLALAGGACGLLVAQGALAVARRVPLAALQTVSLDGRALAVAMAATLASALLAAISPLRETRRQLAASLRGGGDGRSRRRSFGVALQVTVSLVLLVGTTLFARTLAGLLDVPLGFEPRGLLVATVGAQAGVTPAERTARWHAIADAVRAVPGVRAAALTSRLPGGSDYDQFGVRFPSEPKIQSIGVQAVGGDYFRALGIAPLAGRALELADERGAAPVAVINESLARRYWPGESAVGRTLDLLDEGMVSVVGVVPDSKDGELRAPATPLFYLPWSLNEERPPRELFLVARAAGEPELLLPPLRQAAVAGGAGRAPRIGTFEEHLAGITARERTAVSLLAALSGVSVLLTALGLYSLLGWSVAQRTHELGVRAALGAGGAGLQRLVLVQAARLAGAGIAVGVVVGIVAARASRAVLFGITPYDPLNLLLPAALLAAVSLFAAWWPARRATRIDPMTALRS